MIIALVVAAAGMAAQSQSAVGADAAYFGFDEAYVGFPACGRKTCLPAFLTRK